MKKYIAPLVCLALLACTVAAFRAPACQPSERAIVVQRPVPKSLVVWWEYSIRDGETENGWKYERTHWQPIAWQPVAWYAGSVSPENLIARRLGPGRMEYGPAAIETHYRIAWRGQVDGKVHYKIEGRGDVESLRAELQTYETQPIGDVEITTSSATAPATSSLVP